MKRKLPIIYLAIATFVAVAMESGFRAFLFGKYGTDSVLIGSFPNFIAVVLITLVFKVIKNGKKDATPIKMSLMGGSCDGILRIRPTMYPGKNI